MAQSISQVYLHSVWSTKYRKNLILPHIDDALYAYMGGVIKKIGGIPIRINGMPNHIHVLSTLPRTLTIAKYIADIKSASSSWLKLQGEEFASFRWQNGYATFSVDSYRVGIVDRYIQNQKAHHRKQVFKKELIHFLNMYNADYDEQYLWD